MKKYLLGLLSLGIVVTLAACNDKADNKVENLGSNNNSSEVLSVDNYMLSGISGIGLLNNGNVSNLKRRALNEDEQQDVIDNFLLVENLIASEVIKKEIVESDDENYKNKAIININLIDNSVDTYTYYYNEYLHDVEHDEYESFIKGIVIYNDETYELVGEREVEEDEMEVSYKLYDKLGNYIVIEQENEDDEESFTYKKYNNKNLVLELEVEKEYEHGEIEYEFKHKQGRNVYKYEILERGNRSLVKAYIRNETLDSEVLFVINSNEDGTRSYEFINK